MVSKNATDRAKRIQEQKALLRAKNAYSEIDISPEAIARRQESYMAKYSPEVLRARPWPTPQGQAVAAAFRYFER